jgi:hypothetical protein
VVCNFDSVLKKLVELVHTQKKPLHFDFLIDFTKTYSEFMQPIHIEVLLQSLVDRILLDLEAPKKTLDMRGTAKQDNLKTKKLLKLRIAKCWSLIRYLAESPLVPHSDKIELIATPLL